MSWTQDYSVPSIENLLEKLTGKSSRELLEAELKHQGISINKLEEVALADGFYGDVLGTKVTLTDGRVFIPKLTEQVNENGNHGLDVYEYYLETETPDVKQIGVDTSDSDVDVFDVPDNYGETILEEVVDEDDALKNPGWEG